MAKTQEQVTLIATLVDALAALEACRIWTLHIGPDMVYSTIVQPVVDMDNGFMSFGYMGNRKIYLSDISAIETVRFDEEMQGVIYADEEADRDEA